MFVLVSCGKDKIVESDDLVEENIEVKVEEHVKVDNQIKIEKKEETIDNKNLIEEVTSSWSIINNNKSIFWDIEIYQKRWEVNFRIYWELKAYIDKIEVSWFNNWKKRNTFIIDEKWAFEPEWYWWKKDWYSGFRYKISPKYVDFWKNKYIFNAYLNNEIIDKKEFSYDTKVCLLNKKDIKSLYNNMKNIEIKSIYIFNDEYFSTIIKNTDNTDDNIELILEKINCDSWKKEIIFQNIWPKMIRWRWDFIENNIQNYWYYNWKLLFKHIWSNKWWVYVYDDIHSKLIKLINTSSIWDIKKIKKWVLYVSHWLWESSKLILLNDLNEENILYEDNSNILEFWWFISNWSLIFNWFELLNNKEIKLFLLKWNNTDSPEKIEQIIDLKDF